MTARRSMIGLIRAKGIGPSRVLAPPIDFQSRRVYQFRHARMLISSARAGRGIRSSPSRHPALRRAPRKLAILGEGAFGIRRRHVSSLRFVIFRPDHSRPECRNDLSVWFRAKTGARFVRIGRNEAIASGRAVRSVDIATAAKWLLSLPRALQLPAHPKDQTMSYPLFLRLQKTKGPAELRSGSAQPDLECFNSPLLQLSKHYQACKVNGY